MYVQIPPYLPTHINKAHTSFEVNWNETGTAILPSRLLPLSRPVASLLAEVPLS